ncbi:MAG: hypothetical protein M0042_03595 [Nitrospiraceae bacterium]|nr:hypothetical protein [Nitrospiraceae bacterium]
MMLILMIICSMLPGVAFSGEAVVPHVWMNFTQDVSGGNAYDGDQAWIVTEFYITNISKKSRTVIVSLYRKDGTPIAGFPVVLENGSSAAEQTMTDDHGQISVEVKGISQLSIRTRPEYGTNVSGFATIASKNKHANQEAHHSSEPALVATVVIRGDITDGFNLWSSYNESQQINGGNPF